MISEVVSGIMKGDGIGWFSQKKLRRLVVHESLRQTLLKQLYEFPEQSVEDLGIYDVVSSFVVYNNGSIKCNPEGPPG